MYQKEDLMEIAAVLVDTVIGHLVSQGHERDRLDSDTNFYTALNFDTYDLDFLVLTLEIRLGMTIDGDLQAVETVGQLAKFLADHMALGDERPRVSMTLRPRMLEFLRESNGPWEREPLFKEVEEIYNEEYF